MIDELIRSNLIIREWVNGGLLPLNISLVLVIGLFLWESWRSPEVHSWADMQKLSGVSTGCALMWIFSADALRAGAAWSILRELNDRGPPPIAHGVDTSMIAVNLAFIVAGIIGLLASIRCIYLFTPPWLGHSYWIASLALTLTFQMVT